MFEDLINLDYSIMGSKTVAAFMSEHETNCCGDNNKETVWQILCKMYPELYREFKNSLYYKVDKKGEKKGARDYVLSLILDMVYDYFQVCCDKKITQTKYDLIESLSFIDKCKNKKGDNKLADFMAEKIKIIIKEFFEQGEIVTFKVIQCCFKKTKKNEYKTKGIDNAIYCVNELFPQMKNFWNNFYGETERPIKALEQAIEPFVGLEWNEPQEDKMILIDNIISSLVHAGFVKGESDNAIASEYILRDISKLRYVLFKETVGTSGTVLYLRSLEDLATFYVIKKGLPLTEKSKMLNLLEQVCFGSESVIAGLQERIESVIAEIKMFFNNFDEVIFNQFFKNSYIVRAMYEVASVSQNSLIQQKTTIIENSKKLVSYYSERIRNIVLSHLNKIDVYKLCESLRDSFEKNKAVKITKKGDLKTKSYYDLFLGILRKSILCEELKNEVNSINERIMQQCKNNFSEEATKEAVSRLGFKINEIAEKMLMGNSFDRKESITRRVTSEIFNHIDTKESLLNYVNQNPWLFCVQHRFSVHNAIFNKYRQLYMDYIFYKEEVHGGEFYSQHLILSKKIRLKYKNEEGAEDLYLYFDELFDTNKGFQILRNRLIVYLIDVERIFDTNEINQILNEVGFIEMSPNFHEFDRNIVSLLETLENIEEDILEEYKHEQQMQN